MVWLPMVKKFENIVYLFLHNTRTRRSPDRQTDGRTDTTRRHKPRLQRG